MYARKFLNSISVSLLKHKSGLRAVKTLEVSRGTLYRGDSNLLADFRSPSPIQAAPSHPPHQLALACLQLAASSRWSLPSLSWPLTPSKMSPFKLLIKD